MNTAWLLLVCNLLADDVVIRIDRPTTNVTIITITLPEATQVQIQTNVVPSAVRTWTVPPDARASLPRSIPVPAMQALAMRALPDGTNVSYVSSPPMPPPFPDRRVIWIKDWHGDPTQFTYKALVPLKE